MEKEAEFVKLLKHIQNYHVETCMFLLKIACFSQSVQFLFSIFCVSHFGCGSEEHYDNRVICYIHYIKFIQSLYLFNMYIRNIKENQPNHPVSQINAFIVVTLYYGCLYHYSESLEQDTKMVHFCALYPVMDFFMILFSFYMISKVKFKSHTLIDNKSYSEYKMEA